MWIRFFGNRAAVAGTFVALGIVCGVLVAGFYMLCCRKKRRRNLVLSSPRLQHSPFDDPETPHMSMRQSYHSNSMSYNSDGPLLNSVASPMGVQVTQHTVPDLVYRGRSAGAINTLDTRPENPFSDNSAVYQPSGPVGFAYSSKEPDMLAPVPRKHVSLTPSSPSIYPSSLYLDEMDKITSPVDRYSVISEESTAQDSAGRTQSGSATTYSRASPTNVSDYHPMTRTEHNFATPAAPIIAAPIVPKSPPLPAKSPLRAALSQRTLINVS